MQSRSGTGAREAELADELRAAILAWRFPLGAPLPSERALAEAFDISRATVVSAFHALRGEELAAKLVGAV